MPAELQPIVELLLCANAQTFAAWRSDAVERLDGYVDAESTSRKMGF